MADKAEKAGTAAAAAAAGRQNRREYTTADKFNAALEFVRDKLTVAQACAKYGIQSNQLFAWIGQAITEREPHVMAALAAQENTGLVGIKIKLGERYIAEQGLLADATDEGALIAALLHRELDRNPPPASSKPDK